MTKFLLLALAACAIDVPDHSVTTSEVRRDCTLVCGENAATAGDGRLFDEFNLVGLENHAGVRLTGGSILAAVGGRRIPVNVDIRYDELWLTDPVTGADYEGWLLVDLEAQLHFEHAASGERLDVQVTHYNEAGEWFRSGAADPVPVYRFSVRRSIDKQPHFTPICTAVKREEDRYAVVFRGDKYTQNLKVDSSAPDTWAFLACNGSAAMKMHLQRHTVAGARGNAAYWTSPLQRTTLLRAITADYCGVGHSFTVAGTPLAFATAMDPSRFPDPYAVGDIARIEALWRPTGAACLHADPRRPTRAAVAALCGIPTCGIAGGTPPPGWSSAFHVITGVPYPWAVP